MKAILFAILLLVVVVVPAQGQVASASLLGTVKDQVSAGIPNAKVTARHEATGFSREVFSSDAGGYQISELLPGRYTVFAEKQGFRTLLVQGIVLEVNQKAQLDLELQVGLQQENVTITGDVSLVQASDASVGYRLDSTAIRGLPLDGRNVVSLVTLGPGAIPRHLGGCGHNIINNVQESRGAVALNAP